MIPLEVATAMINNNKNMKNNLNKKMLKNSEKHVSRPTSNGMRIYNKKLIKLSGISLLVFICFSFFTNISYAVEYFEYRNSDGAQTNICGYPYFMTCSLKLEEICGSKTTAYCVSSTENCSDPAPTEPICPSDVNLIDPVDEDLDGTEYNLLAPIPGLGERAPKEMGDYFRIIFELAIGLCAVLAVIMIVIGGVQYMGNESIFGKTEAKSKIAYAIGGLLIALGAYALLNTINPDLLGGGGVKIDSVSAEIIDLPDAGDGDIDPGFAKKDYKYSTDATVSPGVTSVVSKLKDGWQIDHFQVYSNETMLISLIKGGSYDNSNIIDIRSGVNGFSEVGQGVSGDKKTPKGTWKILNVRTATDGAPVYNKQGSNMGASFWLLSPMTSGERGIGMHGNKNGTLSRTYGCVRLKNSDILALLPYIKTGTPVIINN